ncbi:PPIase cyclophilin-type domain-containing protein [[Candida] zeylanoides]
MKVEQVRPCAYLDIEIGDEPVGRIVVEVDEERAPLASAQFLRLAGGEAAGYRGRCFRKVIKNFTIQAEGVEGESTVPPEDTSEPLDEAFKVCMVGASGDSPALEGASGGARGAASGCASGAASGGSSKVPPGVHGGGFFITTFPQPHLTGRYTAFGRVVHGKSVVREIERTDTDASGAPCRAVRIAACGAWHEGMALPNFRASYDPRGGDVYEEFPDDDSHIDRESSQSVFEAASAIKESGTLLYKAGDAASAALKYKKALRYVLEYLPDEDQEPDWFRQYVALKTKLYLNLSMASARLGQHAAASQYATFVLEEEPGRVGKADLAKASFRKGSALIQLKRYKEAVAHLRQAQELVDDAAVARELARAEALLQRQRDAEKSKYAKFFG